MSTITKLLRLLWCWQLLSVIGLVSGRGIPFPWNTQNQNTHSNSKDTTTSCLSRVEAYEQLFAFLQDKKVQPPFHIQGWRWHTMSLAREAERLHQLAVRRRNDPSAVVRAVQYVVGFNMKALHKIETELFFPWVRREVTKKNPTIASALQVVLNDLEEFRQSVQTLGSQMDRDANLVSSTTTTTKSIDEAMDAIAERSAKVAEQTRSMLELENTLLVPTIAQLIPESEQKSFNNQVIRNLGIWDSRLHLVSMYEAIAQDPEELALFEQAIPSIPRKMIPRWKRLLYEPAAGDLDL